MATIPDITANDEAAVHDAEAVALLSLLLIQLGGAGTPVDLSTEFTVSTKSEVIVQGMTYTVPTAKTFRLLSFAASTDNPAPSTLRVKVVGASTIVKDNLKLGGGNGQTTAEHLFPGGKPIAIAGDVVEITHEAQSPKGKGWVGLTGVELNA